MFEKKISQQEIVFDYALLLIGLAFAGLLIRALHLTQSHILLVTVPISAVYVFWGIFHHKKHGHIDQKIFLEYALLSLLVNVVIGILVL